MTQISAKAEAVVMKTLNPTCQQQPKTLKPPNPEAPTRTPEAPLAAMRIQRDAEDALLRNAGPGRAVKGASCRAILDSRRAACRCRVRGLRLRV